MKRRIANCKLQIAKCKLSICILQFAICNLFFQAPAARADEKPEVQDVVFLGKARPVLIRLHVLVAGKPFGAAWDDHVRRRFDFADYDQNGTLDRDELKRVPSAQVMQVASRGNNFNYNLLPARLEDVDGDDDGKVTPGELRDYYQAAQATAIQLVPMAGQAGNGLSEALFKQFDRDRDGKLSREELAGAERLAARLDENEDETVSAAELSVQPAAASYQRALQVQAAAATLPGVRGGTGVETSIGLFVPIPRERHGDRLTQRLLMGQQMVARYDKDASGKLTRPEVGLGEDDFEQLDRNDDGVLDVVELVRYVVAAPDLEVTVHLGQAAGTRAAFVEVTPGSKASLAKGVRRAGADGLTLAMEGCELEVRRVEVPGLVSRRTDQFYARLFPAVDPKNKGVVELKQLQEARFQSLRPLFEMADADGDGKVMRKEFDDLVKLQGDLPGCATTLAVGELGQGLFERIDVNKDGRLGVRELRTAWSRLAGYDRNGDGAVAAGELPFQLQLAVSPGAVNPGVLRGRTLPGQPVTYTAPTGGPAWFHKMDRNADGDVSPREFLGSPEQFKHLDEDRDGFIGLDEATKADARLRKKSNRS